MLLDGIFVPLTTPFSRDGRLYVPKLEHNVVRFSKSPAAGMIVLTASGEASALSDDETRDVLRVTAHVAAKEKVLIAGVSRDSLRGSLAVAEAAAAESFDAVLAHAPCGGALSANETLVYFGALADASPLPVVLSSGTGAMALDAAWVAELGRHTNVIGMVDSALTVARFEALAAATVGVSREVVVTQVFAAATGRMLAVNGASASALVPADSLGYGKPAWTAALAEPAIRTRTKQVGFQMLPAGNVDMLPLLLAGAAGAVPALAACAPQAVHEVYAAWKDGDPALAAEKAERIREAARVLDQEFGVAGVKYAADLNGYYGGAPRLPRLPLDEAGRMRVEEVLRGIRN